MSNLNSEFKNILDTLENNMKNKEDLELVKVQIFNLYNLFFDEITNLENLANSRISELTQRQVSMEETLKSMEKEIKNISVDIYGEEECEEDGEYDFTIACPYCNQEFSLEVDELRDEVICPNCNEVIELDWGHDCDEGSCSSCGHHCHHDEDDDM